MSIHIPNLELRKDEMICVAIWGDGTFCAVIDDVPIAQGKAIEVPPHGRFVDADALDTKFLQAGFREAITCRKSMLTYGDARQYVHSAPTIIPADGAGKEKLK